jgi:PadR family transcriptional regulator AphA
MKAEKDGGRQDRTLTTTSYAVLSVLALRDHSTYDLTRQMRLSIHYLWPRAESNVYAEPARLVGAGLVSAREEWTGRRRRTVYAITAVGRAALAAWLGSPSSAPRFESEALLKTLFAENGTVDDLRSAIRSLADAALAVRTHFLAITERYESGEGEYPDRFGLTALAARLILDQQSTTLRWAAWAEEIVSGWSSTADGAVAWGVEALRDAAPE